MRDNGKPETLDVFLCWATGSNPHATWPGWGKVTRKLSEDLSARGLIDYGTSVTHCWLTERGKEHIRELARQGVILNYVQDAQSRMATTRPDEELEAHTRSAFGLPV